MVGVLSRQYLTQRQLLLNDSQEHMTMIDAIRIEIDEIYSLLTYSMVYKYWQDDDRHGRGYNVGSILVSPTDEILDWGINTVNKTENCTQHSEVRLMTSYLDTSEVYSLQNHVIYTSLEPCAMCAGMMAITSLKRTVNGQKDYYFSKAIERLAFNSESIGGYPPYPRIVISDETPSIYGSRLDEAYQQYISEGNKPIITKFLSTQKAKEIFAHATQAFLTYKVVHNENIDIIAKAISFYENLPTEPK